MVSYEGKVTQFFHVISLVGRYKELRASASKKGVAERREAKIGQPAHASFHRRSLAVRRQKIWGETVREGRNLVVKARQAQVIGCFRWQLTAFADSRGRRRLVRAVLPSCCAGNRCGRRRPGK